MHFPSMWCRGLAVATILALVGGIAPAMAQGDQGFDDRELRSRVGARFCLGRRGGVPVVKHLLTSQHR